MTASNHTTVNDSIVWVSWVGTFDWLWHTPADTGNAVQWGGAFYIQSHATVTRR